jgi:nitroreductase
VSRASRVLSLARNRRPPTRFADRPVQQESLACVLEAARWAPSAGEGQPWRFVVVREGLRRHRIAAAAFNHLHARTAPVLVLCCARIHSHVSGNGRVSFPVDVAAAAQTMALAAADLGLATSWLTGYREPAVREAADIPSDVPIVAILAVGYPDGLEPLSERTDAGDVLAWERWTAEERS